MSNRILRVAVRDLSPMPSEAELLIDVTAAQVTPATEVRGRLMGPKCPYAATVEVSYVLRPFARPPAGASSLARRVVIPEASPWEPESPFVYEGPLELWQDGRLVDQTTVRYGLRSLALGPRGLRVNGRPLTLRGRMVRGADEASARGWRGDGLNLLLAEVEPGTAAVWDVADRFGFFVIGGLRDDDADRLALAQDLASRPSCFGWLLRDPDLIPLAPPGRVGLAPTRAPTAPAKSGIAEPAGAHFFVGQAELLPSGLPLLVVGAAPEGPRVFGSLVV
jgi:hypothetical protein